MPARQRSPAARQSTSVAEPASASSSVASDAASALDELLGVTATPTPASPPKVRTGSMIAPPSSKIVRQRSPVARPISSTLPRPSTGTTAAAAAAAAKAAAAEKAAQEKVAAEQAAQAEREALRNQQIEASEQNAAMSVDPTLTTTTTIDNRGRTVSKPPTGTPRSRSLSPSSRSNMNFTTGDLDVAHRGSFVGTPASTKSHDDSEAGPSVRRTVTAPFVGSTPSSTPGGYSSNPAPSSAATPETSSTLTLTAASSPPGNNNSYSSLASSMSPLAARRPSLQRARSPSPAPGSSAGVIVNLREQVLQLNAELTRLGKEDAGKRILELEEQVKRLGEENGQLRQENTVLANENSKYFFEAQATQSDLQALRADNAALKSLLQANNIAIPQLSNVAASPRTPRSPFSAAFATTARMTEDSFDLGTPFVAVSDLGGANGRRPS